ncbi:hypothetical protein MAIC_42400 [Mycolicibacterium aichiense]|uniref:Uncharacterized protein n=2 Tax=Mycolicibacterium aichiense TaxID=1799 RepID=A0A378VEA4_9MYCO|nr:hypothetical protein [Mycolicibacterium aichiense]BBX09437.1 hypothetical protein MAIC_42400 [Mycolicibacterium aichiense]SUA14002.1 gp62 protein [Mycolicibacterium aichiense]SUA14420.1 gp62 protein [Mycolicibacterium aichiense]
MHLVDPDVTEEWHPADWDQYGKAAGHIRNNHMVSLGADLCLPFPLGESRGTRGCMLAAQKAGIPMKAAVSLPAPDGLNDDLMGRAIYELNKLGTIMPNPLSGESAIEVFEIPNAMKPQGAPKELRFLRFVADLMPYVGQP